MRNNVGPTPRHPQTILSHEGQAISVDTGMAKLLRLMWHNNIFTNYSCQGNPQFEDETCWENRNNLAYISMPYTQESQDFIFTLMEDFPAFNLTDTTRWQLEIDSYPQQGKRIVVKFPSSDIPKLVEFFEAM